MQEFYTEIITLKMLDLNLYRSNLENNIMFDLVESVRDDYRIDCIIAFFY